MKSWRDTDRERERKYGRSKARDFNMFKNREERGEREGKIIKGGKKHTERN